MTDWYGGKNAVSQMKAGNDMIMPGQPKQIKEIINAVNTGNLDVAILNKNVERILTVMLRTPRFESYAFTNKPDLDAHAQLTRTVAAEGAVLLKKQTMHFL